MSILFAGTLTYGIFALPDPVAVYFWPATQPDVLYPVCVYLILEAMTGPLLAFALAGLGRVAWALGAAFMPRSKAGPNHSRARFTTRLVFAWALAWATANVWLTIGFDNKHLLTRSICELVLAVLALLGAFTIVVAGLRQAHPRRMLKNTP